MANQPDDKHIICNVNNDTAVKVPGHPYELVNRSELCICGIEAENNFLLESLAASHDAESKLVMFFMVNKAFVHYLDSLDSLTNSFKFPIPLNRMTYEQTLPISLKLFDFNSELLKAPKMLRLCSLVSAYKGNF